MKTRTRKTKTTTGTTTTTDPATAPVADTRVVVVSLRRAAAPAPAGHVQVRVDRRSALRLGNPYVLHHPAERPVVLSRYRALLRADLRRGGARSRALDALAARVRSGEKLALACWCAPLPCHADDLRAVILARADACESP